MSRLPACLRSRMRVAHVPPSPRPITVAATTLAIPATLIGAGVAGQSGRCPAPEAPSRPRASPAFRSDAELGRLPPRPAQARKSRPRHEWPKPCPAPPGHGGGPGDRRSARSRVGLAQHHQQPGAGVDEGDIVKQHGDTWSSCAAAGCSPSRWPAARCAGRSINAFPPGVDASGDWYDEMLVAGDRVVVIGYSYSRGGTQMNRFHIDAAGRLTLRGQLPAARRRLLFRRAIMPRG